MISSSVQRRLLVVMMGMALIVVAAPAAYAIVIRHDRDDAEYRRLAHGFPAVCRVGQGMGTLIDPRWVLTAGHVGESVSVGDTVFFAESAVVIEHIAIHPGFTGSGDHRDLALIRLAAPVRDIAPVRLYAGNGELGMRVTFVGDGDTGDGNTGPRRGPRVWRAAHNTVATVRPGWIGFVFDAPPQGDDLEGISGPGDSGGPALVRIDGEWYVLGASSYNEGRTPCRYGTREFYSRVSDERAWLTSVMAGAGE